MDRYFVIMTKLGEAKFAQAFINKNIIDLAKIVVGDGMGRDTIPKKDQSTLVREFWRGDITKIQIDPTNENNIIIEAVVPPEVGGFTVREVGIIDRAGDLVVVGNYPTTFKPISSTGADKTLTVKITLKFTNPQNVKCVTIFEKQSGMLEGIKVHRSVFNTGVVELAEATGTLLIPDESGNKISISSILEDWISGKAYRRGEFVLKSRVLYRCISDHISQLNFKDDMLKGSQRWEVVTIAPTGTQDVPVSYYDIAGSIIGQPEPSMEVMRFVAVRPFKILYNGQDSQGVAHSSPTELYELEMFINNKYFGKISFYPTQEGTLSYATFECEETFFTTRDILSIVTPDLEDDTIEDIEWTLVAQLVEV